MSYLNGCCCLQSSCSESLRLGEPLISPKEASLSWINTYTWPLSPHEFCHCCLSGFSQETYSGVEPLGLLTRGCKNKIKKGKPHLEISALRTARMYPYMLVYYYLSFYIVPWVRLAFRSGAYLQEEKVLGPLPRKAGAVQVPWLAEEAMPALGGLSPGPRWTEEKCPL